MQLSSSLHHPDWSLVGFRLATLETFSTKVKESCAVAVTNQDTVRKYVDLLLDTQSNNEEFDEAIKKLKSDKVARIGELNQIARQFAGYEVSGTTKAELTRRIVERQALDARHEAESAAIALGICARDYRAFSNSQ